MGPGEATGRGWHGAHPQPARIRRPGDDLSADPQRPRSHPRAERRLRLAGDRARASGDRLGQRRRGGARRLRPRSAGGQRVVVTIGTGGRAPRPYFALAGVAVILAVTLTAMELIYRDARRQYWDIMVVTVLPVAALSVFVLGIWSFFSVERSGLSGRMWLSLWLASGLAVVV